MIINQKVTKNRPVVQYTTDEKNLLEYILIVVCIIKVITIIIACAICAWEMLKVGHGGLLYFFLTILAIAVIAVFTSSIWKMILRHSCSMLMEHIRDMIDVVGRRIGYRLQTMKYSHYLIGSIIIIAVNALLAGAAGNHDVLFGENSVEMLMIVSGMSFFLCLKVFLELLGLSYFKETVTITTDKSDSDSKAEIDEETELKCD